jgi:hypothetical protein
LQKQGIILAAQESHAIFTFDVPLSNMFVAPWDYTLQSQASGASIATAFCKPTAAATLYS